MGRSKSPQSARNIIPASYPAPGDDAGVLVCVEKDFIPFLAEAVNALLKYKIWATEADFLAARQAVLRFKEALVADCGITDRLDEIGVLLALHMRLGALAQADPATLNTLFPALGPKIQAVLAADTGGALDDEEQMAKFEPYMEEMARMFGAIP